MWNVGVILVLVCRLGGLYTEMFRYQPHTQHTHAEHTLGPETPPAPQAFVWLQSHKENETKKSSKLLK